MGQVYDIRLTRAEATNHVKAFRSANLELQSFWYAMWSAAVSAVQNPGYYFVVPPLNKIRFFMHGGALCMELPSKRLLRYWQPRLFKTYWPDGNERSTPGMSVLRVRGRSIYRTEIWHGIFVENSVQATACELLCNALVNLDEAEFEIVMHVYDSVAVEIDEDRARAAVPLFEQCMLALPQWADGLPLGVDTEISARFG